MNNFTKISGWLLFFIGFLIIVLTLWHSYNIFTSKTGIPEFFKVSEEKNSNTINSEEPVTDALVRKAIEEQLKGMLPLDFLTKSLNVAVWTMLALILMSGGSRISDLGIKLIKIEEKKNENG